MNKNALLSMMQLYGDTGGKLAKYLNIARTTFSAKLNETNGAEFTQNEIKLIKNKYNLCAEQIDFIFFSQVCLIKTHMTGMLDYGSEVRAMDKKVENIKALQAELDRRTAVEKLAEKMIIEGKFAEAKELLDTLDDDKVEKLMEAGEQQEIFSHKNVETTKRYIGAKEHTEKAIDLYLKVNCNSDIPKHNFERLNDVINEIVALQEKGTKLNVRILANMK